MTRCLGPAPSATPPPKCRYACSGPPNPCSKGISISNYHHRRSAKLPHLPYFSRTPPLSLARTKNHNRYRSSPPKTHLKEQEKDEELTLNKRRKAMTDRTIIGTNALPSNPTPLSAPQEQQVRDLYYKNVRAKCAKEIESSSFPSPNPHFLYPWSSKQRAIAN